MTFPPTDSLFYAALLLLGYGACCYFFYKRYRRQQPPALVGVGNSDYVIVVAYASQGGSAMRIAQQTAEQLQQAGRAVQLLPLNSLGPELLQQTRLCVLVVSTYGEGEPPDNANRFIARNLRPLSPGQLADMQVAILALGDSSYSHFCGFGHQVYHELHQRGAQCLADVVEVDRLDKSALRHWQYYLGKLTGHTQFTDWSTPDYQPWVLRERACINPGSLGAPAYHLQLQPAEGSAPPHEANDANTWQAGDIVEIGPGNSDLRIDDFLQWLGRADIERDIHLRDILHDSLRYSDLRTVALNHIELQAMSPASLVASLPALPHREYSIASVPAEGHLDLLVRQQRDEQQQLGLGSGWLTEFAPVGSCIRLRIRSNPQFHSPAASVPLVLIGNGTGIAGLRSHLAARAQLPSSGANWLLFGERSAAVDQFFAEDLQRWEQAGLLARCDLVFSRDASADGPRYVQDLLHLAADDLRTWVARGAAIYVCGSLQGMAQAVDCALGDILGAEQLDTLAEQGRYRRDVY